MSDHLLARAGTLWTWTTQQFPPISPPYLGDASRDGFESFGIGWVELPGQLMVESRLTENDPAKLDFGMPVELVIVPFATDDDGDELMTFAFAPST